jgi:Na+/H+ antiporter
MCSATAKQQRFSGGFVRQFEIVLGLVVVATVVAAFAERFRAPAPSLLVLAGLGIGLIPGVPAVQLSPHVVALGILPPLLYAAATDVAVGELMSVIRPVVALAVGLVAVTAFLVAATTHAVFGTVTLATGFVLGAVLASTDPIAVSALARRLRLPPRLLALVQGESLLNDATSLVLFQVAVGLVTASDRPDPLRVTWQFARLGGGGALVGLVAALLVRQLRRRVHDPIIDTVIALLTPYAVYVVATLLGTSGVTAVVLAGLRLGERERALELSRGRTRLQIATVYGVVQFLLESVVFAVIGLQLPTLIRGLPSGDRSFVAGGLAVVGVVLAARAVWVYPASYLPYLLGRVLGRSRADLPGWQVPTVISWVGTRGVVPLAAALSIPETVAGGAPFPHRDLLLVLTTSCILITLVVQGLTLAPLVSGLGIAETPAARDRDEALARQAMLQTALNHLDLVAAEAAPEFVTGALREELERRGVRDEPAYRAVRRDLLAVEAAELLRLRDEGKISEAARRRVQRELDVQEAALEED